jgi:hypothetical protein
MDDIENKLVIEAMGQLRYITQQSCLYEGDERCTCDEPLCESCKARVAYDIMERLLTPCPKPLQERRLKNVAERIFWEEWQKLNKRDSVVNRGFTALEHILNPHLDNPNRKQGPFGDDPPPPPVSTRDAQVAAACFQFLGTNGGKCYLDQCERRIEKEQAEREEWGGGWLPTISDSDASLEARLAQQLADEFVPASKPELQRYMKGRFARALRHAQQRLLVEAGGDDRL